MGDSLRLATGIMGNIASLLLYAAPILTFSRIIKKKSIEEYSSLPYMLALLNCLIYTWYGLPIVSYKWENFLVVTINGIGILLQLCFILIFFFFANSSLKASDEGGFNKMHRCNISVRDNNNSFSIWIS